MLRETPGSLFFQVNSWQPQADRESQTSILGMLQCSCSCKANLILMKEILLSLFHLHAVIIIKKAFQGNFLIPHYSILNSSSFLLLGVS